MEGAIPVGRSFREWWFVALVAGAVMLLGLGAALMAAQVDGGAVLLVAGGVLGASACLAGVAIAQGQRTIEITPGGFLVHDRRGDREYALPQVICASLSSVRNYSQGELKSTTRTFDLWVEGRDAPERIKMINRLPSGSNDPLAPLINDVLAELHERATTALVDRQPFEGEGWTLHDSELVVSGGRDVDGIRIDELAAVDVFDDELCVWRHGQDEPALRVPLSSANAHVLERLLRERIVPDPDGAPVQAGGGLGRVLFERGPTRGLRASLWILPAVALSGLIVTAILAIVRQQPEFIIIGLVAAFAIAICWGAVASQCVLFRCHEHGVYRRWFFSEKKLRFADVESFAYSAVPQYVKGVYSGTTFTLSFVSSPQTGQRKLSYSKMLRHADSALEHLRDHASQVIAARMAADFAQHRVVIWTDGLKFLPEGLEYRAAGFLGRKAPVVIPWEQITGYDVNKNVFQLWVTGQKKPLVKENVALPNFFPGYVFLTRLLASPPATARRA